jgi:hypothetical protein
LYDWSCKYRALLEDIRLWCPLLKGYVDYVRQITGFLKWGIRFIENEKKFVENEDWIEEDKMRDETEGITRRI